MGSCVSTHRATPESAMKLGAVSFASKTDNLVIPESPIKDKHVNHHPPLNSFDFSGSKDEMFFDSRAWLDSDCEDDFFSVNGDFTPSRGSTPVHHNFSTGTPKVEKTVFEGRPPTPGSLPEPSPTGRKRLSELFSESLRKQDPDNQNSSGLPNFASGKTEVQQTILDVLPKSASGTPYFSGANSGCNSERTPNRDALIIKRERSIKSAQWCLPSLISCRSFSDRKKKMSLAIAVNDKS